jgi:hypothetical protein
MDRALGVAETFALKDVVDEVSKQGYQQQSSDATKPEKKMLG